MRHTLSSLLVLSMVASIARAETAMVRGQVTGGSGVALEHVKVTAVSAGTTTEVVYTDHHGRFTAACPAPCRLLFSDPRFEERTVEVEAAAGEVAVALAAKQAVYERIDVTATGGAGGDRFAPLSVASTHVDPAAAAAPPSTLAELVEGVPGVAENGQGGLFQVFSVRGVSRYRVLTLVSGVEITAERRAGVSTSFLDPLLIGSVDVLRGPASTYYGSGALGGVVQVFPRAFDGVSFASGWNSFGDESYLQAGWGDGGWSVGVARRSAEDDEAFGTALNSHFTQYSATISRRWQGNGRRYELLALPAYGDDVGKPNADFPERTTNYPRERHLLLKLAIDDDDGWSFFAFAHPNDLTTEVTSPGESRELVFNEGVDLGLGWQRPWSTERLSGSYGVDYFGRRGVSSLERSEDLVSGDDGSGDDSSGDHGSGDHGGPGTRTLDDGTEDEAALFGTARWSWGAATFQGGGRFTWQRQENGDAPSRDDNAWTGFLGLVRPLGRGFELTANVGTGLRFPSLSERFFTGTTGRGQVLGNPDLEPERSLSTDLGVRWYGSRTFFGAQLFQLRIDDYVERINVNPDLRTFVNLVSGTIRGLEIEGSHQLDDRWLLSWGGHLIDGEDSDGQPLADVAADRVEVGVRYRREVWEGRLEVQHRDRKDDPGSGEMAIPAADLVSASVSYRLTPDLLLTVSGKNLLDEEYFNSADDLSSVAPGRSIGFGVSWAR